MGTVISIIFMICIGAFIGGLTNSLAIKMLFRPHNPIFIGNKRLPFTPGLIPKRRDELAKQLGRMVVDHLLTPESIEKKITDKQFQNNLLKYAQGELDKLFKSTLTIADTFKFVANEDFVVISNELISNMVHNKYEHFVQKNRHKQIKQLLTEEVINKLLLTANSATDTIIENGGKYFASYEGKVFIDHLIDDFFSNRSGKMSGMIQMLIGNIDLAEKVQPEIIRLLNSNTTRSVVKSLVNNEVNRLLNKEYHEIEEKFGEEKIVNFIKTSVIKIIDNDKLANKQLSHVLKPYEKKITAEILPRLLAKLSLAISTNVEFLMEKLSLDEIVRSQVESFPIERLEEMVLSISRREFKMITYLGALLGGIIGFVQSIIVLFI